MLELMTSNIFNLVCVILQVTGGSSFPPALTPDKERQLLEKFKGGDTAARNKLIEHNLRLVAHIIKKYYASYDDQDDLISIGTIGLIKGINSFDPDKGVRLATYAARCIENEILMNFRLQKKTANDVSITEPIDVDPQGNPLTLMDIISVDDTIIDDIHLADTVHKLRRCVERMTDEREKTIIVKRYGLDGEPPLTQREVAENLRISRSYVSRIETKILKKLRKELE